MSAQTRPDVKDRLFSLFARVGQALANPKRVELLDLLAQGERGVEALAAEASMTVANTSAQLKTLRQAGLVQGRRDGKRVMYALADPVVYDLVSALRSTAVARLADVRELVQDHFEALDDLEPISRQELLERAKRGDVVVVDVRPAEEFEAGHIPGAISMPAGEVEKNVSLLPRGREVVAYCRGPFCVLGPNAVSILRAHGFRARRFDEGFPEWQQAGMPVAVGDEQPRPQRRKVRKRR